MFIMKYTTALIVLTVASTTQAQEHAAAQSQSSIRGQNGPFPWGKPHQQGNNKVAALTGYYSGFDTEDGSPQSLALLCDEDEKTCDVTLRDSRFSTCERKLGTGTFFGGVGIAKGVPVTSLRDFQIELFCVENKGGSIDFTEEPTTTLTGDLEFLPNGQLRRTGPGFFYSKLTVFTENGKKISGDIDDLGYNVNGKFVGVDVSDGSQQSLDFTCTQELCDVSLLDQSFTQTCADIRGDENSFWNGVAFTMNVDRTSLSSFEIELYCIKAPQLVVDPTDDPDAIIPFRSELLQDLKVEIIRNPETGNDFYRLGSRPVPVDTSFSLYKDYSASFAGTDIEDSSNQGLSIKCKKAKCDVVLIDSSFSTCKDKNSGLNFAYLGGIARADQVPQDSLHDFKLKLYCVEDFESLGDIDYDNIKPIKLTGDLIFLENGLVKRTGPGFSYYNVANIEVQTKDPSGLYSGPRLFDGSVQFLHILCDSKPGLCNIIALTPINYECITGSNSRKIVNGIAVATNVPVESLDSFPIALYCVSPEAGVEIDYEVDQPIKTFQARVLSDDSDKIVSLTLDENTISILKRDYAFDY